MCIRDRISIAYSLGIISVSIVKGDADAKLFGLGPVSYTHLAEVIRYETDTEPGSSGSPVFDNGWEIIALHHSGGDRAPSDPSGNTWLNNEGIRIDAIVKDLLSQLAQLPGGDKVRNELGI